MYSDLSITCSTPLQLSQLLPKLLSDNYCQIALNCQFLDSLVTQPTFNLPLLSSTSSVKVHSRATLTLSSPNHLHQINQQTEALQQYSLVAIRALNEKIFHAACVQIQNYDIICFEMGAKLPFMLKRNPVYQAIRRGKYFEIDYDSMFDDSTRMTCMTNMVNIIKATNGKNLIVSSRSDNNSRHRSPYDLASLLISLGMPQKNVLQTLKRVPEEVIKSSTHRRYYKGIIKEITVEEVGKMTKRISKHRQRLKRYIQDTKTINVQMKQEK